MMQLKVLCFVQKCFLTPHPQSKQSLSLFQSANIYTSVLSSVRIIKPYDCDLNHFNNIWTHVDKIEIENPIKKRNEI